MSAISDETSHGRQYLIYQARAQNPETSRAPNHSTDSCVISFAR